jgi:nitroreductase/NAD-dependent dihydropyrimidine dehydrogenase PreA subunit
MPWEDVKDILRPDMAHVHMGVMKVDKSKCTKCGLCIQNCPFRAWEKNIDGFPEMKQQYECFSCYNCKVACPSDAIIIVEPYHVTDGYWKTDPHPLPAKMPIEPKDELGNPIEWNSIENAIFVRRSVRNFKDKPVPETIIQRVLEAGRFAPSAGNCQPWKFIVITNKALLKELNKSVTGILQFFYAAYTSDKAVKNLVPLIEGPPFIPGSVDPRVILGGVGSVVKNKDLSVALDAPVVILMLADERAISGPMLNIGICGQNMNLVANSLGIKACWNGFIASGINALPPLKKKLGIEPPWIVASSMCLGYPAFKQEGIVPREYRPVTWFREGVNGPEIRE